VRDLTRFQLTSGYTPTFTAFGNDAYYSDVVRATIHAIATHGAKLKPKHIRRVNGQVQQMDSTIETLLSIRPNPYMNSFDFLYKVITQLYLKNNAFILIQANGFEVDGFYPINSNQVELFEVKDELYVKFKFQNGKEITVPYSQVIHLRRFFNENDIYGESNSALLPTLELLHTTSEGISNAVKSSAHLRGILKFTTAMLKPEDMKKQVDDFVTQYMSINNNGGIAGIDSKADYQELKSNPILVNAEQMTAIEEKVFKYFNVNKKIVMSESTEEEFDAFYETVIEPISLQLSLEFTSKLFTDRERGFGNEIIFEANRLAFLSTKTKLTMIQQLIPLGLISINEAREILNLTPVEDGDKRLVSLNYVDASVQNEYQLGGATDEGN
jgi:HK97 family phage portal protein